MFNQLIYNPAAAGMQETDFNTNLLTRFQWSSVDGAPVTNMFWADYKFSEKKMALGLNFNHDRYGANKNTDVFANYAYYVPLSHKLRLSMGLRLGATFNRFNTSDLKNVWDQDDPLLANADRSSVLPKAGTGFQLISRLLLRSCPS
jgi:type IX secretion system PorP/SprF family membrane protein